MIKVKIQKFNKINRVDDNIVHGMENTVWETLLAPFKEVWKIRRYHQHPSYVSVVYIRNNMRLLGIWPRVWQGEYLYYQIINKLIQILVAIFCLTITCDLYEASKDIILFGDDLVVLIGVYLVYFKINLYLRKAQDIENIITEFNRMHYYFGSLKGSRNLEKIRKMQCQYFLTEIASFTLFVVIILLFAAATSLPPVLTQSGDTPYRAKFPFEWNSFEQYPIRFTCVYLFQSSITLYVLLAIVCMDNIGTHIFTQTTLNLKIFCLRIRELGMRPGADYLQEIHEIIKFHQYIIGLISKINDIFYFNYVAQMGASTIMICLTAFEAVLAQDQPMVAIRFQMFMFSAFAQLLYWCGSGNMVYYTSMEVAEAAYAIEKWYEQPQEFQYCVKFLIRRAQRPLVFRSKPFFGFTFESFTSILSTSYSYFTLLRTMSD